MSFFTAPRVVHLSAAAGQRPTAACGYARGAPAAGGPRVAVRPTARRALGAFSAAPWVASLAGLACEVSARTRALTALSLPTTSRVSANSACRSSLVAFFETKSPPPAM